MKMKLRFAAAIIAAVMLLLAVPAFASEFSDVPDIRWSAKDIAYVVEKGYMNGTGDGKFSPEGTMTRAMVVTVLWRREGSPKVKYSPEFTDVPEKSYYTSAVIWAKNAGIVNGTSKTQFSPTADVTREQLAAMLMRYTDSLHYSTKGRADLKVFETYTIAFNDLQAGAIDAIAMQSLESLVDKCKDKNVTVVFSHVNDQPRHVMEKDGLVEKVGVENFCPHIDAALARAEEIIGKQITS